MDKRKREMEFVVGLSSRFRVLVLLEFFPHGDGRNRSCVRHGLALQSWKNSS